jgi:hypothetical protein
VLDCGQTGATWVAATPSLPVLQSNPEVHRASVVGLCAGEVGVGCLPTLVGQSGPSSNTNGHVCRLIAILTREER